ncbi:hypothetical protein OUZ56_015420 [Daphnia magna]|uniref:Uncharacterized protein n=1 Tax=Daphnia magna TaxID=35525 RepID=A0ABR0AMT0_9CRUS|nr:hypothetical protein OUZ56_015420 [Daphnia magna]
MQLSVQYPAQKSEHRFNFLKPPIDGVGEGRRGDGHDRLPVNVYVVVNGVGVAFLNVMLENGVRFQMR